MEFVYKKKYLKKFDAFLEQEQLLAASADQAIRQYYTSRQAAFGLRVKKLYENNLGKIFEARVSDKIRLLWVESKNIVYFDFLGSHDEVYRYIKTFR